MSAGVCSGREGWERNDPPRDGRGVVGAAGFEPTISCSQSRRATKLRYAPKRRRGAPRSR